MIVLRQIFTFLISLLATTVVAESFTTSGGDDAIHQSNVDKLAEAVRTETNVRRMRSGLYKTLHWDEACQVVLDCIDQLTSGSDSDAFANVYSKLAGSDLARSQRGLEFLVRNLEHESFQVALTSTSALSMVPGPHLELAADIIVAAMEEYGPMWPYLQHLGRIGEPYTTKHFDALATMYKDSRYNDAVKAYSAFAMMRTGRIVESCEVFSEDPTNDFKWALAGIVRYPDFPDAHEIGWWFEQDEYHALVPFVLSGVKSADFETRQMALNTVLLLMGASRDSDTQAQRERNLQVRQLLWDIVIQLPDDDLKDYCLRFASTIDDAGIHDPYAIYSQE